MASRIFTEIFLKKIHQFEDIFSSQAVAIFKSDEGLIHPGEYGRYREESVKDVLRMLFQGQYAIGDGFIITSKDKVSTQCDIIIYNTNTIPIVKDSYVKFYPVEEVYGIGEIKSTLDKTKFKEALIKLAHNKMLGDDREDSRKREILCQEYNTICSFLICQDIKFDMESVDFDELYGDIESKYRHNCILIVNKGCYLYKFTPSLSEGSMLSKCAGDSLQWPFPTHIENMVSGSKEYYPANCIQHNEEAKTKEDVAALFFRSISLAIHKVLKYEFHFTDYVQEELYTFSIETKDVNKECLKDI